MRNIIIVFTVFTYLISNSVVRFSNKKGGVFLDDKRQPFVVVRQVERSYGTSILKNTQSIILSIENKTKKTIKFLKVKASLFKKQKEITVDRIQPSEKKRLFFIFKDIILWKNSQKEKMNIALYYKDQIYKTAFDIVLNKRALKITFPKNTKKTSFSIKEKNIILDSKIQPVFLPLFSNKIYSFEIIKNKDSKFWLNVNNEFIFDDKMLDSSLRDIFDFKISSISKKQKELLYFDFKFPEIISVDEDGRKVLNIKYAPKNIKTLDGYEIICDDDSYDVSINKNCINIKTIKKTPKFVKVSIRNAKDSVFDFFIAPTIKRTFKQNLKKQNLSYFFIPPLTQIYDTDNNPRFNIKKADVYRAVKITKQWIKFKSKYTARFYKVKKEDVFIILGDNQAYIQAKVTRNSPARLSPWGKQVEIIPKGVDIRGYIRADGWIEYITSLWWMHALNSNAKLKFLLKKGYSLRNAPWGKKIGKVTKYRVVTGRFYKTDWIVFEEDEQKYFIHLSGVYMVGG